MPRYLLLSCALLVAVQGVAAQEMRYGDVVVRLLPDFPQAASHGYHEFPFSVQNESATPRRVTLRLPGSRGTGPEIQSLRFVERTVVVSPGTTLRAALWQPPLAVFGSDVEVVIDDRPQRQRMRWSSGHPDPAVYYSRSGVNRAARVLTSQRLSEDSFPPHSEDEYRTLRVEIPVTAWSESWLAYSGYDGIVLTAEDLETLPQGVEEALWRYIETGGTMLVLGQVDATTSWARSRATRPHHSVFEQGLEVDYAGFGSLLLASGAARAFDLTEAQLERLSSSWRRSRRVWNAAGDPSAAHEQFPVTERVEVPVRSLFLVILLFTIVIGPVNLAVLTRRGKRMWLLWTIPLASVLTCAVVFVSALAGEGWVRYRRTEALTVLDERTHRATTLGWAGFYASLTPGEGLHYGLETEVTPIVGRTYGSGADRSRITTWGEDQHLRAGWVRARLPAYFMLRNSELRRERLVLRALEDGSIEAVNGLGAEIEKLWVADRNGLLHTLEEPLAVGAAVRLQAAEETAAGTAPALRQLYRGDLVSRLVRLEQQPEASLRPGTYLAKVGANPFLGEGLDGVDKDRAKTLIFGISAEPTS